MADPTPSSVSEGSRFLASDLDLLGNAVFSDVKVQCGDRTWDLHKVILCSRCKWFRKAFDGQFQEAATGTVVIRDIDPADVELILNYIYTGIINPKDPTGQQSLESYVALYILADYFDVPELLEDTVDAFRQKIYEYVPILQQAKQETSHLKRSKTNPYNAIDIAKCHAICHDFYNSVTLVYSHQGLASGMKSLQDSIIGFFSMTGLYHLSYGEEFVRALGISPQFAVDIMTSGYGLGIDATKVKFPSHCNTCRLDPFARNCYFQRITTEYVRVSKAEFKLRMHGYCTNCTDNATAWTT